MKNFRKLIEGALTDLDGEDEITGGAEAATVDMEPEEVAKDPRVQVYIMQGYQLRMVTKDEDGNRMAMLIKGNPDTGDSIKYVALDEPIDPDIEVVEGMNESFQTAQDVNKEVMKKAKLADSWIRVVMKPHPQITIRKKFTTTEPLADDIMYARWELDWNKKPFAIVLSSIREFHDDALDIDGNVIPSELQVAITVGVHGKSLLPHVSSKLYSPLKKMNAAHRGEGLTTYNEFRDAIEHLMDFLPLSEIPEEYR